MRPYGRKSYQATGNRRGRATEGNEQNSNTKPNEEIESTVQASPTRGANDDSRLLSHVDDDGDRSRKPQRRLLNQQQLARARPTSTQGPALVRTSRTERRGSECGRNGSDVEEEA